MTTGSLFTFRLIPLIVTDLVQRGVDAPALLARAGLPSDAAYNEVVAPLARVEAFVDAAAEAFDDELFGLHLAARVPAGAYGISEFVVRTAASVDAGLEMLGRFGALINPIGRFALVRDGHEASLHYTVTTRRDGLGTHLNEYTIAYIVRQFSGVLDGRMPLARAWFSHARTRDDDRVARELGCPVRYRAPDCGFAISAEVAARRPRTSDEPLFRFLVDQARTQLARSSPSDAVSQLMRVLEVRLGHGGLGIEAVSAAMATTARSLQRRLSEQGTNYRDVLRHVRLRRRGELESSGLEERELAWRLGFSDARAMRRSLDVGAD